jgi:hypothetical protein
MRKKSSRAPKAKRSAAKKTARPKPRKTKSRRVAVKKPSISQPPPYIRRQKEFAQGVKFSPEAAVAVQELAPTPETMQYNLPLRYADNRIVLLARDPWWLHTYWDISQGRIDEVVNSMPAHERVDLRWILRVYNVTGVKDFRGDNARSFFDIGIRFEANNWYINVNQPEVSWCVDIGLVTPSGAFYVVARSNIIATPSFGISSNIDEEWSLGDEDYFRLLGLYDLGKSSMERKRKFEEFIREQISSPLASWGISSPAGGKPDKFFMEVWTELILHGRTAPDAEVKVSGQRIDLAADGTFSLRYSLPPGEFDFAVQATSRNKKHKIKKTPAVKRYDK